MTGIPKLHLVLLFIGCCALLMSYRFVGVLPVMLGAVLMCALFFGRLASAVSLFLAIVWASMYHMGIAFDASSFAFVASGGVAYVLAGNQRLTYRIDNFGQGAAYAGWLCSLLWLINLAIDLKVIAPILGADIAVMLSPLLYGYVIQGVCVLCIKKLEGETSNEEGYFGR